MKSGCELKGHFNIGRQWSGGVSEMIVQIIQGMRISEGQIIRAILYLICQLTLYSTYEFLADPV